MNWVMITWVVIATTLGLGSALYLIKQETGSLWPWSRTESALLVGLSLSVLMFTLYLTQQQRRLAQLRRELLISQRENSDRISRHFDRLVAILHVSRTLGSETDPQAVLEAITDACFETFPSDRVSLMLVNRETNDLEVRSATGTDDMGKVIGARLRIGEGVAGWVAEHQKPLLLGGTVDPEHYENFTVRRHAPRAAMVVPIVLRGELIGVLNVTSHSSDITYTDEDLQALLVFAENAGICCRHAEQSEWMRETIHRLDNELMRPQAIARAKPVA